MTDSTKQSDQILSAASTSLQNNRAGGRRVSIGKGSAELKTRHFTGKIKRVFLAVGAIIIAAMVAGLVIDGIGFAGVMIAGLAIICAATLFSIYPKIRVPKRADLNRGNVKQLVGQTELWLEAQRPALPPPAINLVDQIGVQLDALGFQLEGVDQAHPSAMEVRKLIGEHLPEMVESYRKIPTHLRTEQRAGNTPNELLIDSLGKISNEIDSVTRQLASGPLDDLAIRTRYLDYKYGEAEETAPDKT